MTLSKLLVRGFVTKLKFVNGRRLVELERYLGFHPGRLAGGASFATLDRLPMLDEFETKGYSQVADHRYRATASLDLRVVKQNAMNSWTLTGPDRLIKVFAGIPHNDHLPDDDQYPPGDGVPQWKITRPIAGTMVASLSRLDDVFRYV